MPEPTAHKLDHAGVSLALALFALAVAGFLMMLDDKHWWMFWLGVAFCLVAALLTLRRYGADLWVVLQSRSFALLDEALIIVTVCIFLECLAPTLMVIGHYSDNGPLLSNPPPAASLEITPGASLDKFDPIETRFDVKNESPFTVYQAHYTCFIRPDSPGIPVIMQHLDKDSYLIPPGGKQSIYCGGNGLTLKNSHVAFFAINMKYKTSMASPERDFGQIYTMIRDTAGEVRWEPGMPNNDTEEGKKFLLEHATYPPLVTSPLPQPATENEPLSLRRLAMLRANLEDLKRLDIQNKNLSSMRAISFIPAPGLDLGMYTGQLDNVRQQVNEVTKRCYPKDEEVSSVSELDMRTRSAPNESDIIDKDARKRFRRFWLSTQLVDIVIDRTIQKIDEEIRQMEDQIKNTPVESQ